MRFFKALAYVIFLCFYVCMVSAVSAETIETQLSRNKVALGESITVAYTWHDSSSDIQPDFSPLEKDFRILSTNYGNAIRILNGVTQAQKFWQLKLEPKTTGDLVIPEINFGNTKSSAQKLIVTSTSTLNTIDPKNLPYFVQAEVDTKTPYVQSQIHYTFKLFYQSQLENARLEAPQIKDAVLMHLGRDQYYQTTLQGKPYFVYEKHFAIFPQKDGKLSIAPTTLQAVTYDLSADAMNDPFAMASPKSILLKTKSFTLDVKQIPDQFSAKTWLPAKNIVIKDKWSPEVKQWETGSPITRIITIEAEGLRADQLPDLTLNDIPGINIYTDPPHRSNNVQGDTVVGTLQQKITYIPTVTQSFTLPNVTLPWWNTQTNTQALAQLKSNIIHVNANNTVADPAQGGLASKPSEVMPYSNHMQPTPTTPFDVSIWFWTSLLLLVIWLTTLFLVWKKRSVIKINAEASLQSKKPNEIQTAELNEKNFMDACAQGNALVAQRFLLAWAARAYEQNPPQNLARLCDTVQHEDFKHALEILELALYANKTTAWNGQALLAAYRGEQKLIKKKKSNRLGKYKNLKNREGDPLPPLNP